ncbi:MAG TPA: 2-nitropropane dioxygenase [Intrasporangium sp.]|uniref:2-nitropropane dioxygenase n=1 Tax=Intrasporangium sp. TaxID=1925024 RepID=UPI002B4593C3|nr:2-nitropropane dioxygenase [Intrasporangium sp.]HKX68278.1 2-nitropropane dioxygenase [Intrasporangium sp.]
MTEVVLPIRVRVAMAHAAVQVMADQVGMDILHIKGIAVDPTLRSDRQPGTDADLLVRPRHVEPLIENMAARGWRKVTSFETGSPFGHAATFQHAFWGHADLHRSFPGITADPDAAFDRLWANRGTRELAGIPCPVPGAVGQSVILVLNAARGGGLHGRRRDVDAVWGSATPERRGEVEVLVADLGAEVAFAAATGNLERFRGAPDYDLWRIARDGGTRLEEWLARIKAATTWRDRLHVALRAPLVNTDHLGVRLGHAPSKTETLREFVARPVRGLAEETRALRTRHGRKRKRHHPHS